MYCTNCGNKVHENAYVCVKCGVILNREITFDVNNNVVYKKKKNEEGIGIVSIVFASLALLFCINCLSTDISEVGMYAKLFERIFYAIGFTIFPIIFSVVSLILSLVNKKKISNRIGLALSLISFFLIITEFVVIVIY